MSEGKKPPFFKPMHRFAFSCLFVIAIVVGFYLFTIRSPQGASEKKNPEKKSELRILLNEISFHPAEGTPQFIELRNVTQEELSLEGYVLHNQNGELVELTKEATIKAGDVLLVVFDGENRIESGVLHAARLSYFEKDSGVLWLRSQDGLDDGVAWGLPNLFSVDLCRGGRCANPRAGTVLARLPGSTAALTPGAWAPLDPENATPGEANPQPPVSAFAGLPGMIFTGRPHFSWYSVPGAVTYRVKVARDQAFAQVVQDETVTSPAIERLQQLYFEGRELPSGEYFWRLQALASSGEGAKFSEPIPFSVDKLSRSSLQAGMGAGQSGSGAQSPNDSPDGPAPWDVRKELDVPVIEHAKDTKMLTLEAPREEGHWNWDTPPDYVGYPYCARAGVAMVNAYYGGKLSQDRIGYEAFKDLRDGPEYDLPVVGIPDFRTTSYTLPHAIGTNGTYWTKTYRQVGGSNRNADACMDYVEEQMLEECARQGLPADSQACDNYRYEHEQDIECPSEIGYSWGYEVIRNIKTEIDAGRPIIATTPSHLFLIVGYAQRGESFFFMYQDAEGRQDVQSNAAGFTRNFDSYWTDLAPVNVRSDEPGLAADSDQDNDGILDFDETERFHTDPNKKDSDDDGVDDKVEVRTSVWDPDHGYHNGVVSLGPTGTDSQLEEAATGANLAGRDWDRDGKAMELDPDSDGGGCKDGEEDENGNGKRDGSETSNFDKEDDECGADLFDWEGTINVEVYFNGKQGHVGTMTGRYKWTAEYQAELLEVPTNSNQAGFLLNELVPVEFAYTIHADHDLVFYGGGEYSNLTYAGVANGEIVAEVVDGLHRSSPPYITGNLSRFTTANPARFSVPTSFSSEQESVPFLITTPLGEGWYYINVNFERGLRWDSRDGESIEEKTKRLRDMYRGIDRGGNFRPSGEPNSDFMYGLPVWMPGGTVVKGQLDTPDQREVRGSFFIVRDKRYEDDDPEKITVSWYFKRTPRLAEICEGCVDEFLELVE